MEQDFIKIKKLLSEYVNLILKEYPNCDRGQLLNVINDDAEIVKFNPSNTITFIVQNDRKIKALL